MNSVALSGRLTKNPELRYGGQENSTASNLLNDDRVYKAEDWAWYFATFIANGVFPKPSDGLQVIAYSGMEIKVNTEFMAKINLFQTEAETEFNTWFEGIKDKLGEDIAGSLQLQIEELAATIDGLRQQAEASSTETKETLTALDKRLTAVENGWGINYNHDAVLGLCYMGAAWLSQYYERTEETAVLGVAYIGNSYLANTF